MQNEILKYVLPLLIGIIPLTVVVIMLLKQQAKERSMDMRKETIPSRMEAYERFALLLERTKLDNLVIRFEVGSLSVIQLQQLLLTAIREEYDHNMAQQIFVSQELWGLIGQARESIVKLINTTAMQCHSSKNGMDYAKLLVATFNSVNETPNDVALDYLKEEVKGLF